MSEETLSWLLEGDPSVRWQVFADLLDDQESAAEERAKVAKEGWGAELLGHQDPEGTWAGGLYNPKWISTTYTLLLLRRMGLAPDNAQAHAGVARLLEGARLIEGGVAFRPSSKLGDACVTGMMVMLGSYFGIRNAEVDRFVDWLLEEIQPDAGWNCERPWGSRHGSFHTTITVLEAFDDYRAPAVRYLADAAREFLLEHRLYRSHRTGEVSKPEFTRFSFPPRWHYDVLRGLDHFQNVDAPRDDRAAGAIELVTKKAKDGRWPLQNHYKGREWFRMEPVGKPSRWNT
ncbi:MAG: hypothetical protein ACE5MI_09550, partial [Acidimicrobiia bacterium]